MNLKLNILLLSERVKWNNWPTWLKGLFLFWPSLGPAYLFITRTPVPTETTDEATVLLTNLEYQNYFIAVFIGLWSINLVILGITWTLGTLVSEGYRDYLRNSSGKASTEDKSTGPPVMKEKRPMLMKKSLSHRANRSDPSK